MNRCMFRFRPRLMLVETPPDGGGDGGAPPAGGDGSSQEAAGGAPKPGEEPLGAPGLKALQAERDAHAAAEKRAAELQKQIDEIEAAKLSDLEKAQKAAQEAVARADAAEAKAAAAELEGLRREVAAAKQLPPVLAARLSGTTREELEADAAELAKVLATPAGTPAPPDRWGGTPSNNNVSGRQQGLAEAARRFGSDKT